MSLRILCINPGSTSTKLAVYRDSDEEAARTLPHTAEELAPWKTIAAQAPLRRKALEDFLADLGGQGETGQSETGQSEIGQGEIEKGGAGHRAPAPGFDAVIGRGGLLRPLESGIYRVNQAMCDDLARARWGEHASNLGAILARAVAEDHGCPAFVADPVVVDELDPLCRVSGHPELPRRSIFHALNQKSAAREACARRGLDYDRARLIVAHMGGGCSVGAHREGRVVAVNNALDGEGPFSPERAGTLPAGQLVDLAFSGRKTREELRRMITGGGGLVAHTGTNDLLEIEARMKAGDETATTCFRAMALQIAREIASHGATLEGRVDLVILTGGMACHGPLVREILGRVAWIAPVEVVPGEREMLSLARAALAALRGERTVLEY